MIDWMWWNASDKSQKLSRQIHLWCSSWSCHQPHCDWFPNEITCCCEFFSCNWVDLNGTRNGMERNGLESIWMEFEYHLSGVSWFLVCWLWCWGIDLIRSTLGPPSMTWAMAFVIMIKLSKKKNVAYTSLWMNSWMPFGFVLMLLDDPNSQLETWTLQLISPSVLIPFSGLKMINPWPKLPVL